MKVLLSALFLFAGIAGLISCSIPAKVVVTPVKVEGSAMSPTLNDGDRLLIDDRFDVIERGDIIQFKFPQDTTKFYLKRVVGLPGETVEIIEGVVHINGNAIVESYVDPERNRSGYNMSSERIEQNHYFVLGDNRDNSSDSRYWGSVDRSLIVGKFKSKYPSAERK